MCYLYLPLFILSSIYPSVTTGQSTAVRAAAQQAQTAKATAAAGVPSGSQPDYSKEPFIEEEYSMEVAFENDGTGNRVQYYRVRIESDAGVQKYSVITFPYESATENIAVDWVRVKKTDGTVVVTGPDGIRDMPASITRQAPYYSDVREKQVAVKGLGVGDVLEAQVRWQITKPIVPGQFWFSFNFSHDNIALHEELQISIPKSRAVKWASPGRQPAITDDGSQQVFAWTSSQLQSKSADEQKAAQEAATYETATGQLPGPDIQVSSFQSWAEIGAWYDSLQQDRVVPDATIRAKVAEITKDATTDDAKLRAIYDYVSTQVRYIGVAFGIGRYQPHTASEILANAYGDCKDKHTLLASLLEAVGIKAYPALINSSHKVDLTVPTPAAFDHVITAVPHGKDFVWLDTTPEVAPYGYLLGPLWNKNALVIQADKPAELVLTPAAPTTHAVETFKLDATLQSDGTLEGKVERTVRGGVSEVLLRAAFRQLSMTQWKTLIQRVSYMSGFGGDVSDVTVSPPGEIEQPLTVSYTYTRHDFSQWSSAHHVAPAMPVLIASLPDKKPSVPIILGEPGSEFDYESRVVIPSGYSLEIPPPVNLDEPFATYHATYSADHGALVARRTLVLKVREVPLSDFDAYKAFSKAVDDDYKMYVGCMQTHVTPASFQEAIWALPYSLNTSAGQAYDDARADYAKNDITGEISSLKHAVQIDPKFTRAWLWMSQIYLWRRNQDDELAALRSAVANDPKEPLVYKGLGFALMRARKFGEAVFVWKQLMEVAPDDPDGPEYLGTAFISAKDYGNAIAAFESATKLDPRSVSLYTQMGYAYLQAGDESKAMRAYKQALALDSSARWMNDIGYELADANKQLPLALQYIQKAVQEEEAGSSKIELADLKKDDLDRTTNLAADWDSLGWVYFRMDNLEQAEKYLNAAWVLGESPTMSEHLAEVYEKERKRREAIRTYRLTLSASRDPGQLDRILARLDSLGAPEQRKQIAAGGGAKLSEMRTTKISSLNGMSGSAEFFLLFGSESGRPKVEDVKFVGGSDQLKDAAKFLRSTHFNVVFPDDGPERLLRRGVLSCDPITKCIFVLYAPAWVQSIN